MGLARVYDGTTAVSVWEDGFDVNVQDVYGVLVNG